MFLVSVYVLSQAAGLRLIPYILSQVFTYGAFALIVIFQQEIRVLKGFVTQFPPGNPPFRINQEGAVKVAAGSAMSDGDMLGMTWFVQGVVGTTE